MSGEVTHFLIAGGSGQRIRISGQASELVSACDEVRVGHDGSGQSQPV
jgi:hypothetical protein